MESDLFSQIVALYISFENTKNYQVYI